MWPPFGFHFIFYGTLALKSELLIEQPPHDVWTIVLL